MACPYCGSGDWELEDCIEGVAYCGDNALVLSKGYCTDCGKHFKHVEWFKGLEYWQSFPLDEDVEDALDVRFTKTEEGE